jgi:hypothetical protein
MRKQNAQKNSRQIITGNSIRTTGPAIACAILAAALAACASSPAPLPQAVGEVESSAVPDPFWDFDPASGLTISYDDVDALLSAMVIDMGRSTREKLPSQEAHTGTRLKSKVKRETASEGNRFYFETFEDNEAYKQYLVSVRRNLEQIPSQVPLEQFSREEQLAYWLNLYNIAVLEQLVNIYPERNLKREITSHNSVFAQKILTVEGVPLSLNDIQHTILRWNYDDNPLVIYGLYQGNIGGPNIRRRAYRGPTVYKDLVDNAKDFINSNRGTLTSWGDEFRVSGYYERNRGYFENWETDLKAHLMAYIEGAQREHLDNANRLIPDIEDWTITDVHGTEQRVGGSLSHNQAAMLGSSSTELSAQDIQQGEIPVAVSYTFKPVTATPEDSGMKKFARFMERVRTLPEASDAADLVSGASDGGAGTTQNSEPMDTARVEVENTEEQR